MRFTKTIISLIILALLAPSVASAQEAREKKIKEVQERLAKAEQLLAKLEKEQAARTKQRVQALAAAEKQHAAIAKKKPKQENVWVDDQGASFKFDVTMSDDKKAAGGDKKKVADGVYYFKPEFKGDAKSGVYEFKIGSDLGKKQDDSPSNKKVERKIVVKKEDGGIGMVSGDKDLPDEVMKMLKEHGIDLNADDVDVDVEKSDGQMKVRVRKGGDAGGQLHRHENIIHQHVEKSAPSRTQKRQVIVRRTEDKDGKQVAEESIWVVDPDKGDMLPMLKRDGSRDGAMRYYLRSADADRPLAIQRMRVQNPENNTIVDRPVRSTRIKKDGAVANADSVRVIRSLPGPGNGQLNRLEKRIDGLEKSMDEINSKLDRLLKRMDR